MDNRPRFRVAVIGAGMIANAGHIPAWRNLSDDVRVVAVADPCEERVQLTARKQEVPRFYTDWRKMLAEAEADIVSVCTPNTYHKENAIAALQAGAHVFCEKPVATCHGEAAEMFAAAEAAQRRLFVTQTARFCGQAFAAKEIADSGRLGEIYFAEVHDVRRRGIPTWGCFHMKKHSGSGPLYDTGVHILDRALWLMGNPKVLAASGMVWRKFGDRNEGLVTSLAESGAPVGVLLPRKYDSSEFDVEDMAAGFIRLEGNRALILKSAWAANVAQNLWGSRILGTGGGLTLDPLALVTNLGHYPAEVTVRVPEDRPVPFSGHWLAAEHFVRVLRGEEEQTVKKEEVLNVMQALDALHRSAVEGQEVRV